VDDLAMYALGTLEPEECSRIDAHLAGWVQRVRAPSRRLSRRRGGVAAIASGGAAARVGVDSKHRRLTDVLADWPDDGRCWSPAVHWSDFHFLCAVSSLPRLGPRRVWVGACLRRLGSPRNRGACA